MTPLTGSSPYGSESAIPEISASPIITTGRDMRMAGFGFSSNNFQDTKVTMITCEFPMRVAIPMPMKIIEM
tara:strand:+ start:6707 stop:6919 length:213 start_codon:yes stop_codon:yes gene_type:complete